MLALFAGQALAADYHWQNTDAVTGGDFQLPANWMVGGSAPALPPGTGDAVWLDLAGQAPLINMSASVTNQRLVVENSSPTLVLNSGAVTYTLVGASGPNSSVVVGGTSPASLTFSGRLASNDAAIGLGAAADGTMTLAADSLGAGATWTSSGLVTVGQVGTGSLYLNDGSTLTCPQLTAGVGSSANGSVWVGSSSTLTVAGTMTIGIAGQALLDVADNGVVTADTVVFGLNGPNAADLSSMGLGSRLTVTNGLYLGLNGSTLGDQIAGATIKAGSLAIGGSTTGTFQGNGTGDILLTGSQMTASTLLQVGAGGNGSLELMAGATLASQTAVIGDGAAAGAPIFGNGFVDLADGTSWSNTGNLLVGNGAGGNGTVQIEQGGQLTTGTQAVPSQAIIGYNGTGAVNVWDAGSIWTHHGSVYLGMKAGSAGTLYIASGGQVVADNIYVGGDSTGPQGGGTLTVDGSGLAATLTSPGPVTVWSTGELVVYAATLVVPSIELKGGTIAGEGAISVPINTTGGNFQVDLSVNDPFPPATLELTGRLTSSSGSSMTKAGVGTLVISGPQSHGSGTTFLVQEGGLTLMSDAGSAAAANLAVQVVSPGSAVFGTTQHLRALNVGAGATATVSAGAGATLIVHGLSIASTGAVDLQDNDLVWAYGTQASPYGQVRQWINSGQTGNGGLVTGAASPSPAYKVALAPVDNNMLHILTWNGQTISDGTDFDQIIVKFTYLGDVNLDGEVDARDLANVVAHMNQPGSWFDGDVNGDGAVTIADYNIVLAQMNAGTGGAGNMPLLSAWTAAPGSPLLVPEPGTLGVLAMTIGGLLVRRRK
ncbi:MAG: dockerin type I domain-containing protein [Tepidisphaeraceae bacterium]